MAKRGETLSWKLRFEYVGGTSGQRAFRDEWSAQHAADEIRANAERRDMEVRVEVFCA